MSRLEARAEGGEDAGAGAAEEPTRPSPWGLASPTRFWPVDPERVIEIVDDSDIAVTSSDRRELREFCNGWNEDRRFEATASDEPTYQPEETYLEEIRRRDAEAGYNVERGTCRRSPLGICLRMQPVNLSHIVEAQRGLTQLLLPHSISLSERMAFFKLTAGAAVAAGHPSVFYVQLAFPI